MHIDNNKYLKLVKCRKVDIKLHLTTRKAIKNINENAWADIVHCKFQRTEKVRHRIQLYNTPIVIPCEKHPDHDRV